MNWDARSSTTQLNFRSLTLDELRSLILDGELGEEDWVRNDAHPTWRELGTVPDLADAIPHTSFRRSAESYEGDEMDMTPMIDIVFQLLIFFMLTASFHLQKSLPLPAGDRPDESQNIPTLGRLGRDSIVVSVGPDSKLSILHYDDRGTVAKTEPIEPSKLAERFKTLAKEERKTDVLIQADDRGQNAALVSIIDAAGQAELENIKLIQTVSKEKPAAKPAIKVEPAKKK
jgi:biopolymer transport protein ExbD